MTYLSARTSAYETYALETAIFAAAYAPAPTEEKSFTYILDGEVHTVTLRGRRPHTVTLHRDSHAGFAVTAAHEDIRVRAVYTGTPHEACAAVTPDVSVKKTVTPSDAGTGFYQVTVTVTGKTDRDFYMASLTDRIPTGARFVRMTGQNFSGSAHTYGHLYESGGTVYGSLYVSNPAKATTAGRSEKSFTATYSYLIRAYTAGKFVCESAYLTEAGEGRYALSQRHTVTFD